MNSIEKEKGGAWVVLHGTHTSTKSPVDYVAHIVYGCPRVEAVLVGSHFVALVEWVEDQRHYAGTTFERMGSFGGIGAGLMSDSEIALREFGCWVRHYAPGTVVGNPESR